MQGTRPYPEEPSGPFPVAPTTFEDGAGRSIVVEPLGDDGPAVDALTEMYDAFDAADRAQGIPPSGETAIRRWLGPIVEHGLNVAAVPASVADTSRTDGEVPGYVGHATLVPDTDEPAAVTDLGSIEWELAIFVLQSHQRAGIGTGLLENLLGHAATRGVEHVWLTVERWNGPAISLYERVGFETSSAERFDCEMSIRLVDQTE